MKTNLLFALGGTVSSSIGVMFAGFDSQQGQPGSAPGGTPSQQPQPKDPTPRPSNPGQPGNNEPGQGQPDAPPAQPRQPGQPAQPGQPGQQPAQPGQQTPLERQSDRTPLNRQPGAASDSPRYFTLTDPNAEPRFRESAQQLERLERSMADRNERLVQRLGSLRQLPADRQNAALMDLLQDILQENAQLQTYLVQSRTLFTGGMSDPNDTAQPQNQPADRRSAPAQPQSKPPR